MELGIVRGGGEGEGGGGKRRADAGLTGLWFFWSADRKSRPRRSRERLCSAKSGGGRKRGEKKKKGEGKAFSTGALRPGIGGFEARRRIAGGRPKKKKRGRTRRTEQIMLGIERRALRFSGDRLPVAFSWQRKEKGKREKKKIGGSSKDFPCFVSQCHSPTTVA